MANHVTMVIDINACICLHQNGLFWTFFNAPKKRKINETILSLSFYLNFYFISFSQISRGKYTWMILFAKQSLNEIKLHFYGKEWKNGIKTKTKREPIKTQQQRQQ